MILGVELGPWDEPSPIKLWADMVATASAAVASGFRLLALPAQRWAGAPTALQPLEAASALAEHLPPGVTLVTGPLLVAASHPVDTAEQIATVQHATAGALIVEIRSHASAAEVAPFGLDEHEIRARTREALGVWRQVWFDDVVDHSGRFYRVPTARPTLRLFEGEAPLMALTAQSSEDVDMAVELAVGLTVASGSFPDDGWAAAVARCRRAGQPVVARIPTPLTDDPSGMVDRYVTAGFDHLVLQFARTPTEALLSRTWADVTDG